MGAATDLVPVIVLAGGASRRMGTDKRLSLIEGVPMLRRTLERLGPMPVLVVVDPRDPTRLPLPDHARTIPDTRPGEGPLAALEAGLLATEAPIVLVVAGDMPWLEPSVLRLLAGHLSSRSDATIACLGDDDGPRVLPLALRRVPTQRRVTAFLDVGERRLRALLQDAAEVPLTVWLRLDPDRATLRDVDVPADLAAVR